MAWSAGRDARCSAKRMAGPIILQPYPLPMSEPEIQITPAPPKLSVQNLSVTYVGRDGELTEAVRDVSFDIVNKLDGGEIIVFLGPSGCGKSTILKAIAGLIPPTEGAILVDGAPVTEVGRDRGMVFQAYTSFAWLTVRDNIEYGLKLQGMVQAQRRELSQKYLAYVGLSEFAERIRKTFPAA